MSTRQKSTLQEKFLAKYLGAYTTPNSGAGAFKKGDLQDEFSIIEAKTSMAPKKSYSVKKEDMEKLQKQKLQALKEFPIFVFDYGKPVEQETYVVLPLADFNKLYEYYKEGAENA